MGMRDFSQFLCIDKFLISAHNQGKYITEAAKRKFEVFDILWRVEKYTTEIVYKAVKATAKTAKNDTKKITGLLFQIKKHPGGEQRTNLLEPGIFVFVLRTSTFPDHGPKSGPNVGRKTD